MGIGVLCGCVLQPFFCLCFKEGLTISKNDLQINEQIRDNEIRVVSADGEQLGVMSAKEAQDIAYEKGMDLVKIAPQAKPPVCKIMDYGKYKFELNKREKENRKNQKVINIKEVQLSPSIDTNDFNTKCNHAIKFLKKGDKVKVIVRFRGREVSHSQIGYTLLERFAEQAKEAGTVEKPAKLEGRNMTMRECYEAIGGNYEDVLGRLRSEALIRKFTLKFLEDQSYPQLKQALNDKNYEDAFRSAHTLKGVCQNLSFDRLYEVSNELTELLRDRTGEKPGIPEAMEKVTEEMGLHPDVTAVLSLGEYCAIEAAGGMDLKDAITTVRKRGILMEQAVPAGQGSMAAVMGMETEKIEEVIADIPDVSIANYNCPGQVVITGEDTAVERAGMTLKEAGARRVLPLKVSGPFHSPMLEGAGKKLAEVLKTVTVRAPVTPYVTNVTAEYVTEEEAIKELLAKQVASSVLWQQSVERMIADGVDTFVEIGPGKTLTGFLRKIDCSVKGFSIEKPEDLEKVLESRGNR